MAQEWWRAMQATGKRLVVVSRVSVCIWAIIMGIAMSIAQAATINVNWLITIIGARVCASSHLTCHFSSGALIVVEWLADLCQS